MMLLWWSVKWATARATDGDGGADMCVARKIAERERALGRFYVQKSGDGANPRQDI